MEAIQSFFLSLVGKSEEEVEEQLLFHSPKLTVEMLRTDAMCSLLLRGLSEESSSPVVIQYCVRVLRSFLPSADESLSFDLWLRGVALLGSASLKSAAAGEQFVVHFASVQRLEQDGSRQQFDALFNRGDEAVSLRASEVLAKLASKEERYLAIPWIAAALTKLLKVAAGGDGEDLLVALSSLEVVGALAAKPKGFQFVVDSGFPSEVAAKRLRPTEASSLAAAVFRFGAQLAESGGDRALQVLRAASFLQKCHAAIRDASEVPEPYLDGALALIAGLARSGDSGKLLLCEDGLLTEAMLLARVSDSSLKVRGCMCVAEVLASLNRSTSAGANAVRDRVAHGPEEASKGFVAKVLSTAQLPLMTEQKVCVLHLLAMMVREVPQWTFHTTPSLIHFMVTRNPDAEPEETRHRFAICEEALALGKDQLTQYVGQVSYESIDKFTKNGAFVHREAKASIQEMSKN